MAHHEQTVFVTNLRQNLPDYFNAKKVLEVGSLDINGSVRSQFVGCDYLGIDVGAGNGVDLVCSGQDHGAPARSYDVVISCEMMEHNPNWRETWLNMLRLVKGDGLLVMTCASVGRPRHGTRDTTPLDSPLTVAQGIDHYRNLVEADFTALLNPGAWFSVHGWFTDFSSHDLYFFGVGPAVPGPVREQAERLKAAFTDYYWKKNVDGAR